MRPNFDPDKPETWPLIMTAPQVSKVLQVSHTKVYQMIKGGELPYMAIGHSKRVPRIGFMKWMETGTAGGQ